MRVICQECSKQVSRGILYNENTYYCWDCWEQFKDERGW